MENFEDIEIWGNKAKTSSSSAAAEVDTPRKKEEKPRKEGSSSAMLVGGVAACVLLAGAAFGIYSVTKGDSSTTADGSESAASQPLSEKENEASAMTAPEQNLDLSAEGTPALLAATQPFPESSDLEAKVQGSGSAWVVANQEAGRFSLSGVVPDEATKEALDTSLKQTWGQLGQSNITVDSSVEGGAWLQDMPRYMKLLTVMMTDTSMSVNNDGLSLDGVAPNELYSKSIIGASKGYENLPPITNNLEVQNLIDPNIDIKVKDGKATLAGYVADQESINVLTFFLENQYGEGNVESTMTIRENAIPSFLILRFDQNIKTFSKFSEHQLKVAFNESKNQRQFSGQITSGIAFDTNSTDLAPTLAASLENFIGLANRVNRPIQIIGHTDSEGDASFNLELSKKRAENVKKAFIEKGMPEDRVFTFGKGEEQLLIPNEQSEEDKRANRRVEIIMGELEE